MSSLEVGDKAPKFTLANQDNKEVSLSDYDGKAVIIAIYVMDGSSGCKMDLQNIQADYSKIKKAGYEVLGLSKSSVKSHEKFHDALGLKFDLLSDPDSKVIKEYGAYGVKGKKDGKDKYGTIRRQVFIDDKGKVQAIIQDVDVKNSGNQILDEIKSMES